jgi:hypothetical protein
MTTLLDDLVPDELRALMEPLLPAPPRPPCGAFDQLHLEMPARPGRHR